MVSKNKGVKMKTKIQNHKADVDFQINKGFNAIVKDIKANKGNVYKVVDLADGNQVLVYGGGHDDMGLTTFIFKNNAKTRKAFHNQPYGAIDGSDYGTDRKYILHQVDDCKVAPYKDDRKYNVDIDWRKVKACKTIDDFVAFVDKLDVFNTWYSDINWTGYDFCIVTDGSKG
jgi:hypothetical protein